MILKYFKYVYLIVKEFKQSESTFGMSHNVDVNVSLICITTQLAAQAISASLIHHKIVTFGI